MTRRTPFVTLLVLASFANSASAEEPTERFLVPIASTPIPGAHGSLWETELWYRNDSDVPTAVAPQVDSDVPPTRGVTLPYFLFENRDRLRGLFLHVDARAADGMRFHVRIRDTSRSNESWGTELPVVRERDFFGCAIPSAQACSRSLSLLSVPTDVRFRVALRIYEAALEGRGRVRVTIHRNTGDEVLGSAELDLPVAGVPAFAPGFAQILSLRDAFPAIAAAERVRISIEPPTPGARFWAFVSVTNNETQQVTTITP